MLIRIAETGPAARDKFVLGDFLFYECRFLAVLICCGLESGIRLKSPGFMEVGL
jgi:hypothetical protein